MHKVSKLDDAGGPRLPGVLHTSFHGKRAVERYTASPPPTTPLQSSTAYIQLYTALYSVV